MAGLPGDVPASRRCGDALEQPRRLATPHRPPRSSKGRHRRRCALPVLPLPLSPPPPHGGSADRCRSCMEAAVPLLPRVLCGLSSLLASVCTVMPQGSCVKAWPRCTHQQDGHCLLTTSEGVWCARQAAVLADHGLRPFAWRGTADVYACRTRRRRGLAASAGAACPPTPRQSLRSQGRSSGLALAGLCAAERDAVEGFPWPGRPRGWAQLGSRSPGLPLAAAVFLLGGDARYAALAPASRPALRAPQRRWVPALTPAPSAWAARRKQENQKLQRPAAYRPGERSARFSPPPLRRPWEAQPPLCVAVAHSPQKNTSPELCIN